MISIAAGGFFGAVVRYVFYLIAESRSKHPKWATWAVNSLGSFSMGWLLGNGSPSAFWLTGFLGAFTTFSTMALDAVKDIEDGEWLKAAAYLSATLISGILLFSLGYLVL
ncbi:Putative fluoride ion transporter CrcB [Planococcus massiliensis]|uniref:Fluoride-specific ion channel FluC n=1 Tax=Planococcus massiliensis TaxID=1499687 RepID=A0A098ENZ7_9BACL|nr:CrcB family protein [Planococcus massiliensis]CEG24023.1 Putative fluoride ion transporter CrcB [Planococcus massiliensis]